jgi:hypothetical protein
MKVLSSGVGSDPKDSKSFFYYEGKSFSKILYKFRYEIEIVTFQKIIMIGINTYTLLYSSEGGRKDKTKKNS